MNEPPDPLETELSALRPLEASPGLRRRVGERLANIPSAKFPRLPLRWLALAGGLAAACLAAVLLRPGGGPEPIVVAPELFSTPPTEDSRPTLLAYQHALARAPEELDALLKKDAQSRLAPKPELARIGASTRSDAALHALLGDD